MSILVNGLKAMGLEPSEVQLNQFELFYHELVTWNEKINLTSITDYDEVMVKHFLDSVNLVQVYNLDSVTNLIDVGTGAGFPGIPIKIMFPHIEVVLMDALNKRVQFMNNIIELLNLDGIQAVHGRAEILGKDIEYRERYDLVVSRAVSNLATLSEYTLPFVKLTGDFVAFKSKDIVDELTTSKDAIEILGGCLDQVIYSTVPESDFDRSYVIIRKIKETPGKYPRKAGIPSKKPL